MLNFDEASQLATDYISQKKQGETDSATETTTTIDGKEYEVTKDQLSALFRVNGYGGYGNSVFSLMKGINHHGAGDVVSPNLEHKGIVLFTRPELNLTSGNISGVRRLRYLLNSNPKSLANYIRTTLMPHTITSSVSGLESKIERSPYVEERSPFIALLSNTLKSISGWPDEIVNMSDSTEGMRKQVTGIVDDTPNNYGQFDLTASFQNKIGDPILSLFSALRQYMTTASVGGLSPFPKVKAERYLDYTMRIYVLITDEQRIKIHKMACVGTAVMKGLPTGASFNFNNENPTNRENEIIDVPFHCYGVRYNDPIIMQDFNSTVKYFNPDFYLPLVNGLRGEYKLIPETETQFLNFEAIPFINTENMELEWYCKEDRYNEIMDEIQNFLE
jgi:hypothetical protein